MWSHERHLKILEQLIRDGKVYTNHLTEQFAVSRETIRRDLLELEDQGSLRRVHGGAVPSQRNIHPEPRFSDRLSENSEAKQAIGQKAAGLIRPGSTLFIDAGTTTLAFTRAIMAVPNELRIITNSIEIAQLTASCAHIDTLLLGGKPHTDVPGTYGELTLSEIQRFLADVAVISPVGFHLSRGATDYELHEAEVARKMLSASKSCILLCHAEKIHSESRVTICRPEEVDHLVTDAKADPEFILPRGQVHFAQRPALGLDALNGLQARLPHDSRS